MCSEEYKCAHIVILQHSVTTHSWLDCTLIQVSYLHVEEVYLDHPIRNDRCCMSCLHARSISDLPMGNGPGLQQPSPLLAGPSAVHTHRARRRAEPGHLPLSQIPIPHPAPVPAGSSSQSPRPYPEVFSPHIPHSWGATPVASEEGCGTGELHRSRRLGFANLDLDGSGLVNGCTGKASNILTSSD